MVWHYGHGGTRACGEETGFETTNPVNVTCAACKPLMVQETALDIQRRLRTDLLHSYGTVRASDLAVALTYELGNILAKSCPTPERAHGAVDRIACTLKEQIDTFGVGGSHP